METWKAIAGYEGLYEVSDQGRVKSLDYNHTGLYKILKPKNNGCGYFQVGLYKDGHAKQLFVHRLVAEAFIPNPNNLDTINHKDEVKTNNAASNLEWLSRADNIIYSRAHQVQMFDKSSGQLLATFSSTHEANRVTGIAQQSISACCRGVYKSAGGFIWKYF